MPFDPALRARIESWLAASAADASPAGGLASSHP
jgi:hypothetical protein